MAQPYVGEIRMFAGNFPPVGWLFCSGQQLPISENETLYQLIGTTYGGDGQETFNVPNLQSRIPIHMGISPNGTNRQIGEMAGVEAVTLTQQQIPSHSHPMIASTDTGQAITPAGNVMGALASVSVFRPTAANQAFNAQTIAPVGGSQPHDNMHPFLCVNFIISLYGLYPNQT